MPPKKTVVKVPKAWLVKYDKPDSMKVEGYGKRSSKRRPKVGKLLKRSIQEVINSNAEDKFAFKTITNVNYNSGIDNVTDLNFLLPQISNGTTDNARIGDQIKCHTFKIRGHILANLTFSQYSQCRIGVRMMVVQPKLYSSQSAIQGAAATWLATLLKKGGTTAGFTGLVSDLYAPINNDAITTYYDKVTYLRTPYVPGANTGDNAVAGSTRFFSMSLRVKNKKLMYDAAENSGLTPVNYCPTLIIGYAHLDSASADVLVTQVNLNWDACLTYQDM